jgi:peptidoglycan/LPS O-acetylase OafA/YrhL
LVVGAVAFLKPGSTESGLIRRDLPFAAIFASNLTPMLSLLAITWSLSAEEQFYLLAPVAERYARRLMPFLLPLAYLLVSLPPFGFFPSLHLPHFFRETTFGPILLGVMLAHVLDDPRGFSWVSRVVGGRLGPLIPLLLIVAGASYPVDDISGWPRIGVHWAMVALVASCVVSDHNLIAPILSLWPMRRIGMVSYGIYLYHLSVMHFVVGGLNKAGVRWPLVAFVGTALATWILAELSYRLLEVRFLALKARFTQAGATA